MTMMQLVVVVQLPHDVDSYLTMPPSGSVVCSPQRYPATFMEEQHQRRLLLLLPPPSKRLYVEQR
jgi:hypothetical protein